LQVGQTLPNVIAAPCRPTPREEFAHAASHAFGLVASLIGLGVLVTAAWTRGEFHHVVGCSVFGVSLVLCYATSTLYHAWQEPRTKRLLQLVDYIAIYLLIAGTYTPFLLATRDDANAATLLIVVWGLAILGIAMELVRQSETRRTSIALYLFMGFLMIFAVDPVAKVIDPLGLTFLVLGAFTYASGVIFFLWDQLPYNHAVWHGFVLAGSGFHFTSVLAFLVP
jgi:hemolysin III